MFLEALLVTDPGLLKVLAGLDEVFPLVPPLLKGDLPLPRVKVGVQLPSELDVLGVLSVLFGILYLTSLDPYVTFGVEGPGSDG